jgi:hypothetical protein
MRWTRQLVNNADLSCNACMHDPHTESTVMTTANHHVGKGHEDLWAPYLRIPAHLGAAFGRSGPGGTPEEEK